MFPQWLLRAYQLLEKPGPCVDAYYDAGGTREELEKASGQLARVITRLNEDGEPIPLLVLLREEGILDWPVRLRQALGSQLLNVVLGAYVAGVNDARKGTWTAYAFGDVRDLFTPRRATWKQRLRGWIWSVTAWVLR